MEEHDLFGDSVEYGVDCNGMGDVNEDDTGDSSSTAEDYMDDKICSIHSSYRIKWITS